MQQRVNSGQLQHVDEVQQLLMLEAKHIDSHT